MKRVISKRTSLVLCGSIIAGLGIVGCENPSKGAQGAAIGAGTGVAAGALVGGHNGRLLGGLLGGALGAGGGYLIGSYMDNNDQRTRDEAIAASQNAEMHPVTAEQARAATTADINHDGFETMDEVVAMKQAGLSDAEMVDRLQRTGMFFDLTPQQQSYLRTHGVSQNVINAMQTMNPDARQRAEKLLGSTPGS